MLKDKLENIIQEIYQPIKEIIDDKNSKKYFIYLIIIYLIGYASILRADVYYIDDFWRSTSGASNWDDASRHLSNVFSKVLHMGWKLSDVSPLTQLIAIVILSTSSILLVKIINKKLSFMSILASVSIGLFPYFLQSISYKFDSPYMAFSVLSSIFPFLWYQSKKRYFITFSILGVLGTLLTYQSANGVYLIVFTALLTKDFFLQNITLKEGCKKYALIIFNYMIALLLFRYLFMINETDHGYAASNTLPVSDLLMGIWDNLKKYILLIKKDLFGGIIGYFLLFIGVMYIVKMLNLSKRNKIITFIFSLVSLSIMLCLSWGAYIILERPLFAARAYLGFCLLIGLLALTIVEGTDIHTYYIMAKNLVIIFFIYSLMAFANSYGNALYAQNKYTSFRITTLAYDLSKITPNKKKIMLTLKGRRDIGHAKAVINASYHYPLIKRLIRTRIKYPQIRHFIDIQRNLKIEKMFDENIKKKPIYSNAFHTIEKAIDSDCYFVTFK